MKFTRVEEILFAMLAAYEKTATDAEYKEAKKIAFQAMDALTMRSRGGTAKSEAKAAASRLNGLKGGRPKRAQS